MAKRITEISVLGLFGMFDHVIPLNMEEGITIIYGENGIGKTMIFRILEAVINQDGEELLRLPFNEFHICVEPEGRIEVTKDAESNKIYVWADGSYPEFPHIERKGPLIISDIIQRFLIQISLGFISTQRLEVRAGGKSRIPHNEKAVIVLAGEMREMIAQLHKDYANKSKELEGNLRERLSAKERKRLTLQDLRALSAEITRSKESLKRVGLWEDEEEHPGIDEELDEVSLAILGFNLSDLKEKLKIFDEARQKLDLFLEIINERRFTFKKLNIDSRVGFSIINDLGEPIALNELSSGEQHELVMIYQLLFGLPDGSLVLIDEPEISLHAEWKRQFLSDMQEIIKLRGFQMIIATHSVGIINNHWELTCPLKGARVNA